MTLPRNWNSWIRRISGVFFLMLLAVCGYVGAYREPAKAVSVDVTRSVYALEERADSMVATIRRLDEEREREMALLRDVFEDSAANAATRENAAEQLAQLAERMEVEAQCAACLENMGYDRAAAVYGAQMLTVFVSAEKMNGETDKTRILDALSSMTGIEASDIKIILTKK